MIIVEYILTAILWLVKATFKFIWAFWCLPGNLVIMNAYRTAGNGKGMDGIDEIARTEREYNLRHFLAPLYSIPLWGLIFAFIYGAGQP